MSQAIKVLIDIIFIVALIMVGIGLLTGMTDISYAKGSVNNVIAEISNSHYDNTVISQAVNSLNTSFNEDGEGVMVTLYTDSSSASYSSGDSHTAITIPDTTDVVAVKIELAYKYHFLGNMGNIHHYSNYTK